MLTILSSASARPNFVKLAAVHHALAERKDVRHLIVHTGQHYDPLFSDIFFKQLSIPLPDRNLGIKGGLDRETIIDMTACAMTPVIEELRPDLVLVYGDVNGAVGAARAAKNIGIRLGHIEAGLRSFDPSMPEEVNRIEIDRLADLLFVSEASGMRNLQNEKITGQAHLVGNTMIDTLVRMMPMIEKEPFPKGVPDHFAVVTLHRPSNVDTKKDLEISMDFLRAVSERIPLVFPLHRRTRDRIREFGIVVPSGIHIIEPLGYIPFLALLRRSAFILTDSGGIQEEAAFLAKRCFTLRRNTERPSTVDSGSNVLIDPGDLSKLFQVLEFAENPTKPDITIPEKWDGKAGMRIAALVMP